MRFRFYSIIVAVLLLASCANRGSGPQGGPKDSIPPVPRFSEPEIGTLNFHGDKIEVTFDEYIQLDNIGSHLMISPPQQNPPEVKARGKKMIITFQDSLFENTTYTLDFGSAVCDYREKTPLKGYSFYFSTGEEIDTLETFGQVYDAQTLNPMLGVTVGIYANLDDTAFVRNPFLRISKTDSTGGFRIGNIHPGTYRIYAVDDISRDYRLTIGESLAFTDDILSVAAIERDTTDSVMSTLPATFTRLFLFKEKQQKLYLQRSLRDEQHKITFLFSSKPDSLPIIHPLTDSLRYHIHYSKQCDTVSVWLTDSFSIGHDSLFWEVKYRQTDSVYNLVWVTDTLRTIWRAPKLSAKAKETQERIRRNKRLDLKTNARKGFEIFDTLRVVCSTPLASYDVEAMHLVQIIDTVRKPVLFTIAPHDTLPMEIVIMADMKPEGNYELLLDSGALHDVYGITHIKANYNMQVKALSEYSTIRVMLKPFEQQARIQLLNGKDEVLRELPAAEEGALFEYLKPDSYYLRLYLDKNGDGTWTTGSWTAKRQPEPVYYYPEKVQTKSNWDFEEEWNYLSVEQTQSKPKELIKIGGGKK